MRTLFDIFFLDFRFLDKKEKDTSATVLEFCFGARLNFVRMACSSYPALDMSGKEASINFLKTACKITSKPKTPV